MDEDPALNIEDHRASTAFTAARDAAAGGNPESMIEHLYASFYLDGLARGIQRRWPSLPAEDVDFAIAQAVDALYQAVQKKSVVNLPGFLWKVADRKANDCYQIHSRERATDPEELVNISDKYAPTDFPTEAKPSEDDDFEKRRLEALRLARSLIPRLGQQNIQAVFNYLLDALEAGAVDVPNAEIADALGLSAQTVRTSLSRGFARLTRIARAEGLIGTATTMASLSAELQAEEYEEDEVQLGGPDK